MKPLVIAFVVLFGTSWNAVGADDSASVLARILAEKGTISSSELARVEFAASPDKTAVLASILADKGVLSSNDLARVKGTGSAERVAAEPPPPQPAPQPPSPPKVKGGQAIVSETKSTVSV